MSSETKTIENVIWGRVKYKWKNNREFTLLQEKTIVYSDKTSESEWVPVDFDEKERKQIDEYNKRFFSNTTN